MKQINSILAFSPVQHFDMTPYIEQLHQQIEKSNLPVVLVGNDGSGKTHLCMSYYQALETKGYFNTAWIDFIDDRLIDRILFHKDIRLHLDDYALYKAKTAAEEMEMLISCLAKAEDKKIIIIDALDRQLTVQESNFLIRLKQEANCDILINSIYNFENFENIAMPVFQFSEAEMIFKATKYDVSLLAAMQETSEKDVVFPATTADEKKMIEHLSGSPLLLEIFSNAIAQNKNIEAADVLQYFEKAQLPPIQPVIYSKKNKSNLAKLIHDYIHIVFSLFKIESEHLFVLHRFNLLPKLALTQEELEEYVYYRKVSKEIYKPVIDEVLQTFLLKKTTNEKFLMHNAIHKYMAKDYGYIDSITTVMMVYLSKAFPRDKAEHDIPLSEKYLAYFTHIEREVLPLKDEEFIIQCYPEIAICYRNIGNHKIAIYYEKKLIEYLKKTNLGGPKLLANAYRELGLTYKRKGEFKEALAYITKGLVMQQEIAVSDEDITLSFFYTALMETYSRMKDNKRSAFYAEKALAIQKLYYHIYDEKMFGMYCFLSSTYSFLKNKTKTKYYSELINEFFQYQRRGGNTEYEDLESLFGFFDQLKNLGDELKRRNDNDLKEGNDDLES